MNKTLVISGHPNLDESLTNRIIINRLSDLEDVEIRDIISLYPDFKIDIEAEQKALLEADQVVLQFPFYWYSIPGIMKEWMDRVLAYGFAYGSTGDKLKGKPLIISTTIGGPEEAYQEGGYNNFRIEDLLLPLRQTAYLTGMPWQDPVVSHGMVYIPGVYNVKEEVEQKAKAHATRLIETLEQLELAQSTLV
jgi:glutathione-regulated potassium-efflux system ancillary protein KefF